MSTILIRQSINRSALSVLKSVFSKSKTGEDFGNIKFQLEVLTQSSEGARQVATCFGAERLWDVLIAENRLTGIQTVDGSWSDNGVSLERFLLSVQDYSQGAFVLNFIDSTTDIFCKFRVNGVDAEVTLTVTSSGYEAPGGGLDVTLDYSNSQELELGKLFLSNVYEFVKSKEPKLQAQIQSSRHAMQDCITQSHRSHC